MSTVNLITYKSLQESFTVINWKSCFICQNEDDKKQVQNPSEKRGMLSY